MPPPLWLTSAWPSSYLVSGNHPTVGLPLFHGTARNGMAYSVALFSGMERLKFLDRPIYPLNHFQTLYYVTFVTNKTSRLFLVADN